MQASPHQRSAVSSMYPAQGFPQGQLPSQLISHLQGQIQGQLQNRISPYAGQLQGGISLPMGTPADQQVLLLKWPCFHLQAAVPAAAEPRLG